MIDIVAEIYLCNVDCISFIAVGAANNIDSAFVTQIHASVRAAISKHCFYSPLFSFRGIHLNNNTM